MEFRIRTGRAAIGERPTDAARKPAPLLDRAVALAHRAAERPYASAFALLAVNLALIGPFVAIGDLVFADPAELFRELMPGTWLSVAQLGFVAVIALAIHREAIGGPRLRLNNLWGISVVVFTVLAIDEATQLTIFFSDALTSVGTLAPAGFQDLDAFLVTVLLLACGAALLRYGTTLLRYPAALGLLAIGVALGAGSQALDSIFAATTSEFVAEESLKLAAEPLVIGGYLLVLHRLTRRRD